LLEKQTHSAQTLELVLVELKLAELMALDSVAMVWNGRQLLVNFTEVVEVVFPQLLGKLEVTVEVELPALVGWEHLEQLTVVGVVAVDQHLPVEELEEVESSSSVGLTQRFGHRVESIRWMPHTYTTPSITMEHLPRSYP
jgi:hypothetical protein